MKTIKTVLLFILTTTLFFSCNDDCDNDGSTNNNVCDESFVDSAITNTYSAANGYSDLVIVDYEIHEYQIQINADGEICSIGYQNPSSSNPWAGYTGDYTMEVINTTSGAAYSGLHSFSQSMLDYQPIAPVIVMSGDIITVRRIGTPFSLGGIESTRGQVFFKPGNPLNLQIPFPITEGNVTFLNSNLYYEGNISEIDNYLPYIALGFKAN